MAWSSDGTLFATGSEKGKVEIYNAKEWLPTLRQSEPRSYEPIRSESFVNQS